MGIRISVYDAQDRLTACKLVIGKVDADGISVDISDTIVYCKGEYEAEVEQGEYRIEVYKGKLYEPFRQTITVTVTDERVELQVRLTPRVDTWKLGLYAYDAHSHVSRNDKLGTGNLGWASTVMMAEDFQFFYAGSPYDHATHLEYLNKEYKSHDAYREQFASELMVLNSDTFQVDIGNEFVKCRYGHLCMLNFTQTPPFSRYYDENWDPWNDSNRLGAEPSYEIAYPYEAVLAEKEPYSFTFSAHPTSWWWGANGVFITNIASTLAFDLLAGTSDAMVVMGYGSDKIAYQAVWFEALKQGYHVPGVAETDVAFDGVPKQKFLQYKTYAFLDEFSKHALGTAMKRGKNLVSSGPILVMTVNGEPPGTVFPYQRGEEFEVAIEAYACYEASLSSVQLIVNGEIAVEVEMDDMRNACTHTIKVEEDSFVLAKCYDRAGNVAMTSPVYVRNKPFVNKGYQSKVSVHVTQSGRSAGGVFWIGDETIRYAFEDQIQVQMSPASTLNIAVDGVVQTVKLFELPELQAIFKHLYLGGFNLDKLFAPGEVPPEAFQFARVKEILDNVELNLVF